MLIVLYGRDNGSSQWVKLTKLEPDKVYSANLLLKYALVFGSLKFKIISSKTSSNQQEMSSRETHET